MSAEKILIVDDDKNIRKVVSLLLIDAGYETVTAADGFTAIEMARESNLSVVIVDLKMPGLTGIETHCCPVNY